MEIQLTLECLKYPAILPLNYQYELSAWVYRVMEQADILYAHFLHEKGYKADRKTFKLFCFSPLRIAQYRLMGDRMSILSPEVGLSIRFCAYDMVEEFVEGLFEKQAFWIGDRKSRIHLRVKSICAAPLQLPHPSSDPLRVRVRMQTPLVVSRKRPDQRLDEYLSPDDPDFGPLLVENLLAKYRAFSQKTPSEHWPASEIRFRFCPERTPRSKLITIKSGTPQETRVRGWLMDFEITAPRELIAIGMLAGWGRANSQGFGFGEILTPCPKQYALASSPSSPFTQ